MQRLTPATYVAALLLALLLALLAAIIPTAAVALPQTPPHLSHYVAKYRNLTVSSAQRQRLARYDHLIEHFSAFAFFQPRHRVDPDFIRALILAESNADPAALSGKQARGLTQILYETGRTAADAIAAQPHSFKHIDKNRLRLLRHEDLHDPAINILIACYLVSKYNYQFDGRLELVVSAWNAGEHSIQRKQPPAIEETHELIGRVNGYFVALLRQRAQPPARRSADIVPTGHYQETEKTPVSLFHL